MAWKITSPIIGAQPITETSTTKRHPLGMIVQAADDTYGEGQFMYCQGVGSTVAGSWATLDYDGATALLAANAKGPVGVAMSANVASQYGWYQINGKASGVASTVSIAAAADLYATATAGVVGSTVVTGDRIWGTRAAAAASDGTVLAEITRPFVNDGVNGGTS